MKYELDQQTIQLPQGVLRIKPGMNPNSSSMGTLLYALPVSLALVGTIAGVLCAAKSGGPHEDADNKGPSSNEDDHE